jgi:broad specificity phosphatase PhoE
MTWADAKERFRGDARAWRDGHGPPPGGETHGALRCRVRAAAQDALNEAAGKPGEIVLVTHHTPIRALLAWSRGWAVPDWRRFKSATPSSAW